MAIDVNDLPPAYRAQVEAKIGGQVAKRAKYGNVRMMVNGIKFDSAREADRFLKLDATTGRGNS